MILNFSNNEKILEKVGLEEEAAEVMEGFKWGHNFIEMNEEILDKYQKCKTSEEIKEVEAEIKAELESAPASREWDPFDIEGEG